MHIPDGFLNNNLAGCFVVGALGMLGYCLSKILKAATIFTGALMGNNGNSNIGSASFGFSDNASKYFQNLAIIAIWVFAFQMFNIPIQSATSAHLIGGVFAAVLAGPLEGFVIMSSVLILQGLFFSDGGILALGANIFNMAFVGSFLSYYIYKTFLNKNHYLAVFAACLFSVLTASLSCLIELSISGTVSFLTAFEDMMNMHLIVALLETGITLVLLKIFKNLTRDTDE
ncbi:MAG: energy-coupling factor ABC transporter permease [Endomicrobium sp.]|nr:energy-coupling factor ABC transporter permease [Endomicrobium sp.]